MRWIFSLPSLADRDLGAGRDVAAVAHVLGEAAEDALRRRLAPAGLLGDRVEHGEVLGMVRHQLAPELERILAGRMGQLVHEAFEIDGVLVDVHAAPEARRHVRVAHRVVDQQVRDGVADRRLAPPALRPWKVAGSMPFSQRLGPHARRGSTGRRCACAAPVRLPLASKPPVSFALRDRMIGAVRHVLFARPDQLDRRARHLLGDQHRLGDVVWNAPRRPKPPPSMLLVHVALVGAAGRRPPAPRRAPPRRSASPPTPRTCRGV